jgi:hypothetical protein
MLHPPGPGGLGLRLGRTPCSTISREEIGVIKGFVPLSTTEWLELMRGRLKDIEFKHRATVEPVLEQLQRAGVPFDEVLGTSFLSGVVDAANALGLRTGLLIGRRGVRVRDWTPRRLLDAIGAEFVAVSRRQRRTVLDRCGDP